MSKLKLNIEDLKVESFATSENLNNNTGTVKGQGTDTSGIPETGMAPCLPTNPEWETCCWSCMGPETCYANTCNGSCDNTCPVGGSCPATCMEGCSDYCTFDEDTCFSGHPMGCPC